MRSDQRDILIVIGSSALIFIIHAATPAGPHAWHWIHLLARKMFLLPILFGAARFGVLGSFCVTFFVSGIFLLHVVMDWRTQKMLMEEQMTEIITFWIDGSIAIFFFQRIKSALRDLRLAHEDTFALLAGSLELRERRTAGHSERVRDYSLLIARKMDVRDPAVLKNLGDGAMFHDVGKIGISDKILLKAGPLNRPEMAQMQKHPEWGADLIGRARFLSGARELVLSHHERFNGGGYPRGISGENIPLGARIFAVADAFDAMTADRPYHTGVTLKRARSEIARESGCQFDPKAVEAFLGLPDSDLVGIAERHGLRLKTNDSGTIRKSRSSTGRTNFYETAAQRKKLS
ncbi:MAG: HD-GYP domain-containing protein [Spirochaetia bacterium]|nr:HD-GYP domain-containing protein [Spirochaetia bacterium]